MDRFVVRESRAGAAPDYPQGNQMMAFSANAGGNNMVPETMYLSGPFAPEYTNVPRVNSHNMTHIMTPNNMTHNFNPQMALMQPYAPNLTGQGHISGIDPRYLAGYADGGAQFFIAGQQIQRNPTPINCSYGTEYQNRSFVGIDRNKPKSFTPQVAPIDSQRPEGMQKAQQMSFDNKNAQENTNLNPPQQIQKNNIPMMPVTKKPNEIDLPRNDGQSQNQIVSRADKLKALYKSGPRAFSGPVEKVLKWHKSLQDIGILIFYEIVAKCVSVRPGELCSKNLVVRDDNGPAMQVVYYEVDFLLPELKPPCTIRVIGRMMAGTSRLQAFSVRPATGDDVATLSRRAAVAAHHVAKLCKEYGPHQVP